MPRHSSIAHRPPSKTPRSDRGAGASPRRQTFATELQIEVALGRAIWAERGRSAERALHWTSGQHLLAVVNMETGQTHYRSKIRLEDVERGHMVTRPNTGVHLPEGFRRRSVYELLWQYGQHAPDALDHLPTRLFEQTLFLTPRAGVAAERMNMQQVVILDALRHQPQKFTDLAVLLDCPKTQLVQALAPLYLSRTISTRAPGLLRAAVTHLRSWAGRFDARRPSARR